MTKPFVSWYETDKDDHIVALKSDLPGKVFGFCAMDDEMREKASRHILDEVKWLKSRPINGINLLGYIGSYGLEEEEMEENIAIWYEDATPGDEGYLLMFTDEPGIYYPFFKVGVAATRAGRKKAVRLHFNGERVLSGGSLKRFNVEGLGRPVDEFPVREAVDPRPELKDMFVPRPGAVEIILDEVESELDRIEDSVRAMRDRMEEILASWPV